MSSPRPRASWLVTIAWLSAFAIALLAIAANWWLDRDLAGVELRQAEGRVTVSRLDTKAEDQLHAVLVVSYEVDGRRHTTTPGLTGIEGDEQLDPRALVDRFAVGVAVPVWYVVGAPEVAYLRRPSAPTAARYLVGAALTLGLLVLVVVVRVRAHRRA